MRESIKALALSVTFGDSSPRGGAKRPLRLLIFEPRQIKNRPGIFLTGRFFSMPIDVQSPYSACGRFHLYTVAMKRSSTTTAQPAAYAATGFKKITSITQ